MNIYPSNFNSPFKPTALADFVISDDASRTQLDSIVNGRLPFPLFGKNAICPWGINGSAGFFVAVIWRLVWQLQSI